ncbi:MAG: polyphosphate kinase 1 [Gammaproteobacteria bacterium]|nr:polyphosphate kinase 1 [Gammaproteobacteria bacterium]
MDHQTSYFDRDLSWLAFNHRVLQEAGDSRVPLLERLRFAGIFSSNLDEFFRVRVAALRTAIREADDDATLAGLRSRLRRIHLTVDGLQRELGRIVDDELRDELRKQGIALKFGAPDNRWRPLLAEWFESSVRARLSPQPLFDDVAPFLENRALYLVVALRGENDSEAHYQLVEIPSGELSRFVQLAGAAEPAAVLMLDDVIRLFLADLFPGAAVTGHWSIKLSRDAELYIDDEFSGDLKQKIHEGVQRRRIGPPCRLLFDATMPEPLVERLREHLRLQPDDLVRGGRYHNYSDFLSFPKLGPPELRYPAWPAQALAGDTGDMLVRIAKGDVLLSLPYQSYAPVLALAEQAALADDVTSISMTLYRAAENSRLVWALAEAARRGKQVRVFVEAKARFDEAANLEHARRLVEAGANVMYSMPGLKVHAKLMLIEQRTAAGVRRTGVFSTGNFNEQTASFYSDFVLLTADPRLTDEAPAVFDYLSSGQVPDTTRSLLIAPFNLRQRLTQIVEAEMEHARGGRPAEIWIKLNNLEDEAMIDLLHTAMAAGVRIRMVLRSICRLIPRDDERDRLEAISIVDRNLEHARVVVAHNNGEPQVWLGSADWMVRNLDRRIEVVFPLIDAQARASVIEFMRLQLADTARARILDAQQSNRYRHADRAPTQLRAQQAYYEAICQQS